MHDASLARQRREGRVALRRLNRTEYETTLRDLLATPIEVKDLLPDDNIAAGFDNVSAVLDISPTHLLRYQDAAEKAVRAVIPKRPLVSIRERRTGRQITEKLKLYQELLGKSARLDGDTLVLYLRPSRSHPVRDPARAGRRPLSGPGCASAVNTGGKPLPMMCVCRPTQYDREDTDVRDVRDVPAGEPLVIEEEFDLREREVMVFAGWSLPHPREFERVHKGRNLDTNPTLPGLAVHWIEIEGPLGPWPPLGYRATLRRRAAQAAVGREGRGRRKARPAAADQTPGGMVDVRPARPGTGQSARGRRAADAIVPAAAFRRPVAEEL